MNRQTKNATGGDVAASSSTSGVRPTPTSQEIVMTNHTPTRPWLDFPDAHLLTEEDRRHLDEQHARWSADPCADAPFMAGIDSYLRDCAMDTVRVRRLIGPDEIARPDFVTVEEPAEWELTPDRDDAVRYLDAQYVDVHGLNATLACDQYALSGRLDLRVRIADGEVENPSDLARWASDLIALADRWAEILEAQR